MGMAVVKGSKKKYQSVESQDEKIVEIDEDYVFPISFICKDNKSQACGKEFDKESEAGLDKETENNNDKMKLDSMDSQVLCSSMDNTDEEAQGKGDSLDMYSVLSLAQMVPESRSKPDGNHNDPLKTQECPITSKDDLKKKKKRKENGGRKRLKKKYQSIESHDEMSVEIDKETKA